MNIDEKRAVLNRLKRAHGQLSAVISMIENDRPCEDVIPQLAACSKAVQRAGMKVVVCGIRQRTTPVEVDQKLEKMLLSLA